MKARGLCCVVVLTLVAALPRGSRADRRYFTYSYTPWRAPAGSLELETWLTARSDRQAGGRTAWEQRVEFEFTPADRLTLAGYLNYRQGGAEGEGMRFEGPSVEVIYQLAERGRIFADPALYLEAGDNGQETDLEAKLLLGRRFGRVLAVSNLVGEFEFRRAAAQAGDARAADEAGEGGKEFKSEVTLGLTCELSPRVAVGLEARYLGEYPEFKARDAALVSIGPVVNFQSSKVQLALTVLPQTWGTPAAGGTQIRAILGIDL